MVARTESKVYGSTIGGGAGAILTSFILWLLGVLVWGVAWTADDAANAIAAVPLPVSGLITGIVTLGGIFGGGWISKHTPRPEDATAYQPKRVLEDPPADPQVAAAAAEDDAESSSPEVYPVPEYASV